MDKTVCDECGESWPINTTSQWIHTRSGWKAVQGLDFCSLDCAGNWFTRKASQVSIGIKPNPKYSTKDV